jgi:hypothetical protein
MVVANMLEVRGHLLGKALRAKVPTGEDAEWVLLGTGKGQAGPVTNMEQVLGKKMAEGERAKVPTGEDAGIVLLGTGKAGAGPVADRLQVSGKKLAERMIDNGKGTGTMERACVVGGKLRKGNTDSDEKFAGNLITNSLGLSAVELAEYKKVRGDLRKFMGDTKSTMTAASDLSIDKRKLSKFLCGTLRYKGGVRRTVAAVVLEALTGR